MKPGKLVTIGVLVLVGWQYGGSVSERLELAGHIGSIVRTYLEMSSYKGALRTVIEDDGRPPRNLSGWLDQRYGLRDGRRASVDYFGTAYMVFRGEGREYLLRSCGPDQACRNDDDLVVSITGE